MNNSVIKGKKTKYIIILIIGILFLLLGLYYVINQHKYIENGVKVEATVENILTPPNKNDDYYEIEIEHYRDLLRDYKSRKIINEYSNVAIIISYEYNGTEYLKELGYFSDNYRIGQVLFIYLNKNNPKDFISEKEDMFSMYASIILGFVLTFVSVVVLFTMAHNQKAIKYLLNHGNVVKAKILYIDENEKISKYNRHPSILTCSAIDENSLEEKIFTSDSVYLKESNDSLIGTEVFVYVDKVDHHNYYVDVRNLG